MKKAIWTASDTANAKYLGMIEFQDENGEYYIFEVMLAANDSANPSRIIFGGMCNAGFIESGYIEISSWETLNETLSEMLADLQYYYNQGPASVSRIICNERM